MTARDYVIAVCITDKNYRRRSFKKNAIGISGQIFEGNTDIYAHIFLPVVDEYLGKTCLVERFK